MYRAKLIRAMRKRDCCCHLLTLAAVCLLFCPSGSADTLSVEEHPEKHPFALIIKDQYPELFEVWVKWSFPDDDALLPGESMEEFGERLEAQREAYYARPKSIEELQTVEDAFRQELQNSTDTIDWRVLTCVVQCIDGYRIRFDGYEDFAIPVIAAAQNDSRTKIPGTSGYVPISGRLWALSYRHGVVNWALTTIAERGDPADIKLLREAHRSSFWNVTEGTTAEITPENPGKPLLRYLAVMQYHVLDPETAQVILEETREYYATQVQSTGVMDDLVVTATQNQLSKLKAR